MPPYPRTLAQINAPNLRNRTLLEPQPPRCDHHSLLDDEYTVIVQISENEESEVKPLELSEHPSGPQSFLDGPSAMQVEEQKISSRRN